MVALPPLSIANSRMLGLRWIPKVAVTGGGRCARYARGSHAGRDMRAYGAGEAAEPPRAQQTGRRQDPFTPKSRSGIYRTTARVKGDSLP